MSFFERIRGVLDGLRTTRGDSWQNELTGLGILGRDKLQSATPGVVYRLSDQTLGNLFDDDAIAARLVTKVVDDAMRQGVEILPPAEQEAEVVELEWERLTAWSCLKEADIWGRLYGAGAVFVGVNDGGDLAGPLVPERINLLHYLVVLDGTEYTPSTYYSDPLEARYGEPEVYRVMSGIGDGSVYVHESRLIQFGGALTPRRRRKEMGYRDYSVLQKSMDALRRFDSDWRATSSMMSDGSQGVLRMKGFADVIAGGSKEVFATRMELINLCRSVARIMPLDADEEDFSYVERSWAGVADLLDKTTLYLAASAGMPVTVLFGRSPSGMNATGESDRISWYDSVQEHRDSVVEPAAQRLLEMVCRGVGVDPAGWTIHLPALLQESDAEYAARRKLVADTDAVYIASEVLQPEEVAIARFGSGEWSDAAPVVDVEGRQALLDMDLERAKNPPPPPPPPVVVQAPGAELEEEPVDEEEDAVP